MSINSFKQAFEELAERLILQHWDFYPTAGSRIGRHEYDGMLPDLSPDRLRRRAEELRRGLAQLSAADQQAMGAEERLNHRTLQLFLKRELFTITDLRPIENNPMRLVGYLNVGGCVRRDYAPLADRLRSATQALLQVPDFLEVLDSALVQEISGPVLEMSIESYAGMARFYRKDLSEALAGFDDRVVSVEFDLARETASAALDRFVDGLKSRLASAAEDFAIGPSSFSSMLADGEGLEISLAELVDLGQASLESNLERLAESAASIDRSHDVGQIVKDISRRHPSAEQLVPATSEMLEDLRQAIIDLDLVSVPSVDRCLVIETPTYMRYAFAAMDSAGSLETRATESYYYVTPVEPDWTPKQQEEWLSNFNYETLRVVSIHEVFPGHFLHYLHNRYGPSLSLVRRVATSYAFTEGWAHYAEQMMVDSEYGANRAELKVTQVLEALVRNCRYLCSIWMHTQGMSLEEATQFFMDYAHMSQLPARREAQRGTFDPGYLNYTLGKMMFIKLSSEYRKEQGAAFTPREFHDRLLSYGAPPIPLLREAMLKDPSGSPL